MRETVKAHPRLVLAAILCLGFGILYAGRGWVFRQILAPALQARLASALQRDVAFTSVDTNLVSFFSVKGFRLAKGATFQDGTMIAAREAIIRYRLVRLIRYPKQWQSALRRVELIEPYLELDVSPRRSASKRDDTAEAEEKAPSGGLPPLPKTYLKVKGGTLILARGKRPLLKVQGLGAHLDLRDLPRIEGSVSFAVAPQTKIAAEGECHLRLKDFKGAFAIEDLNLDQFSALARAADPGFQLALGGLLDAELEIQGGFMTLKELFRHTNGTGRLSIREGTLAIGGEDLITGMSTSGRLIGRRIKLEKLRADFLSGRLQASGSLGNLGMGRLLLEGSLANAPVAALRVLSPGLPRNLGGQFTFDFSATGTGRAPVFTGRMTAQVLSVPGVRVQDLTAAAVYTLDEVRLTDLSARLWDGEMKGQGWIGGLRSRAPEMNVELKGEGFNVSRSPLGKTYAGFLALSASVRGPLAEPVGFAQVKLTQIAGHGVPVSDLAASARFKAGTVEVEASTARNSVSAKGTLLLKGGVRCRDCRLEVQEEAPVILALVGVRPPTEFGGRVVGTARIDGLLGDPVIQLSAVGTGIRVGEAVLGERIEVPGFVFNSGRLEVPAKTPLVVSWSSEHTRISMHGEVPAAMFSRQGTEELKLSVRCENGRLGILERLNLVKKAEGRFDLDLDMGGTASYPIFKKLNLAGSGKRIILHEKVLADHIHRWDASINVKDNEGTVRLLVAAGKKVHQELDGTFGMAGWEVGAVDVSTQTVGSRGIPFEMDNLASLDVHLRGSLLKEAGEEAVTVTSRDPEVGAELILANGTISYDGMGGSSDEDAGPGPIAQWADRWLNFIGTIKFERNVSYRTKTLGAKAVDALWKVLKEGELASAISEAGGMTSLAMAGTLGFDVRIRDGGSMKCVKEGTHLTAEGELALEPGGQLRLFGRKFTIVDVPGSNKFEFLGGEQLAPRVNAVGETVLYDTTLQTDSGEMAEVDELKIRLLVTPRQEVITLSDEEAAETPFLNYEVMVKSEPAAVTGLVRMESTSAEVEDDTGAEPAARPVSIRPSQGALIAALVGERLAAVMGTGKKKSGGGGIWGVAASLVFDKITSPLKWCLERMGIPVDVLRIRKSDTAKRRRTRQTAQTPASSGVEGAMASALDNTEVTIGKNVRDWYVGYRGILLDASGVLGTGRRSDSAQQNTSALGHELELEYRRGNFKLKGKGRFYSLPDDVKYMESQPKEVYAGGEVSQKFRGVGQREIFEW